ncbi:MAG: pyocin knob domain-containing protein, partial [Pseudomonas sp.]
MAWYKAGTVALTIGQSTVIGTGTDFAANARVGDAFRGPDGRWYEVTNIASATVLSIFPAYQSGS